MRAVATWDQTPDVRLWPIACEAGRAKETPETGDAGPVDQKLESRPHASRLYVTTSGKFHTMTISVWQKGSYLHSI